MKASKQSAKRWKVAEPLRGYPHMESLPINDGRGFHVAYVNPYGSSFDDRKAEETRDRIIRCVNAHDELVDLVQQLADLCDKAGYKTHAKKALAHLAKLEGAE